MVNTIIVAVTCMNLIIVVIISISYVGTFTIKVPFLKLKVLCNGD